MRQIDDCICYLPEAHSVIPATALSPTPTIRWKEISEVKRPRFTLLPAPAKGLKRLVEGETCL
ncbi:MAG: hypothetical protein LBK45_01650 [Tannerellaceae bacterium]|jgi:hypothetical protein|nr:hypothetical protein [Tannerellaceae bacterium]